MGECDLMIREFALPLSLHHHHPITTNTTN
jgi:hypothetical protein